MSVAQDQAVEFMFPPFDQVRAGLERQYLDAVYAPQTGADRAELAAQLERHRAERPDEPRILTKAWLFELLCGQARLVREPDDYFVGKVEHHGLPVALREEWRQAEGGREFRRDLPAVPGAYWAGLDCASHVCPDWRSLLELGVAGVRDRAAARSGVYHQAVAQVYGAMITLLKRFAALHPGRGLEALAERPPRTFHEALQLAFLYHELQEWDGVEVRTLGRFDQLHNALYLADLRAGRLTRAQAKEMLKYFFIKFYAQSQGRRFGKPFLFGPQVNELSFLAFEVFRELRTVDPKFHVRLGRSTPAEFLELVAGCIRDGCTSIVLVNDEAQVEMLCRNGKARADAEDYILIGCYEPAVMGKELNCSGAASLNLAKPVELALAAGAPADFEGFLAAYYQVLDAQFADLAQRVRRWERLWPRINPSPLLSGPMAACHASGRDVSEAGAQYNTTGCCCVGLANAVDSLAVVKHLVYEERHCSLAELKAALADDWQGHEELRRIAQGRAAKWGNHDDRVDRLAVQLAAWLGRRINREPNARGGVFQAALYGILGTAEGLGRQTGALPDGRRAGEPLTLNTGATPGRDRGGVTSLINSVTKLDLSQFPNGTVLDLMLHPTTVGGREGVGTICALIRSHFAQGGLAVQFNIFDAAGLREAQRQPEKYAHLQVRVCGWSVRFGDLTPAEQEVYITKAEAAG